jgi:O-antigen ligase
MQDMASDIQSVLVPGCDDFSGDDEVVELTEQMTVRVGVPTAQYRFSKALVLFVLATVSVLFGAVQAWVWSMYTVAIYAAFIVFVWQRSREGSVAVLNGYSAAMGLFGVLTLFACLPLPGRLMAVLSPVRYALLTQTRELTGIDAVWPTLSYAPFQSLGWWAFLLGLVFLFALLKAGLKSRRILQWSLWILLGLAVIQGLYGILQALVPNLGVLWVTHLKSGLGNARGTWINRNHFAGFMGMMVPLMLGFALSRVRWGSQLRLKTLVESDRIHQHSLLLLALVIMALALLFSKSRAGIMSLFLGVGTFISLIRGRDRKMPKRFWIIAGSFLGLTLLYGVRMGFDPIIDRFLVLEQGNLRLDYWKDSLAIIADHPLGIGLATFKYVFPVYNVTSLNETITPHFLHNDVLQLLVETGWPGFALLIGAYLVFMVRSFRRIRRMDFYVDPMRFFVAVGAFSGLVSISFHSFFDFNLQIPANAVYFVVLLAMLKNSAER